jgi:ABC-type transport system involved in Fe-S cluster assembly fused permease/ATPase subunit
VRKWLGLRAIWRWAVQTIVPAFVGMAVVAAIIWLTSHHFDIRYWAELAIFCVIFTAGFPLRRHLRTRRSAMRGPDKG